MASITSGTRASRTPTGVHLVGSVLLSSAEEVFSTATKTLPDRLHSVPDGETGHRHYFVRWQSNKWKSAHPRLSSFATEEPPMSDQQLSETITKLKAEGGFPLQYDTYALESYKTFQHLRSSGVIPPTTKFQACLPTTLNLVLIARPEYRDALEPFFHAELLTALNGITSSIPAADLVIQWDCACEFAILEAPGMKYYAEGFKAEDGETFLEAIARRLMGLFHAVDPSIEVGLHCCYGDRDHKHFIEPPDLRQAVDLVNAVQSGLRRHMAHVHMPVPRDRSDEAYFAPLRDLKLTSPSSTSSSSSLPSSLSGDGQPRETKVFLGLVHHDDLAGTTRRIETATHVVPELDFGVATECGMGRTPADQIPGILDILAQVSNPY